MFTIKAVYQVNWYSLFYLISSVLTFLILFYMGWKKGYPLLSWILILVTGSLFFIIGTKLLTFRSEEWSMLFREGVFPHTDNKSAIGGLLFAILGIQLSRSWLKVREFVLDTYALMVPLGLAIQKVGCLLAGCCFGTPTTLPWGVQYAQGTVVHYHHWITNTIPASGILSLPVHPVPLYEMISYLLIFGVLILLAPYLQKKGSRFLLAITLLALSRFTLEFFRDPAATVALGQTIGGLKAIQWVMLVTGILTGFLLLRKQKHPSVSINYLPETHSLMGRKLTMIFLLSLLMWAVHDGFSPTEMLVMNFKLLPALILFGAHSVAAAEHWTVRAASLPSSVPAARMGSVPVHRCRLSRARASVPATQASARRPRVCSARWPPRMRPRECTRRCRSKESSFGIRITSTQRMSRASWTSG